MKIFLYRITFLLLLVVLQTSFFNILFPWFQAPLFLLGSIVIFTLIRSFPGALFMTVPLTVLFDIASAGIVTTFSLYAVIFSYGTSFLSRRLLIEHRGIGLLLYAFVSYSGVLLYQTVFSLFVQKNMTTYGTLFGLLPSSDSLFYSFIFSLPIFIVTYFITKIFEEHLAFLSQKQFLNVR